MKPTRPQVRIRNAGELFDGLRHSEAAVRLPTLAAVAAQPDVVLAYGTHQGLDVIDELCNQLEQDTGLFAPVILNALVVFRDERVVRACCRLLQGDWDSELLSVACQRLATEDSELARACLRDLLFSEHPARATAAARSLKIRTDLELEEKIRVKLWVGLEDARLDQPEARTVWLQLLEGPLRARARRCLEELGVEAFAWLSQVRPHSDWLLQWGCERFPQEVKPLLQENLETDRVETVLRLLAEFPALDPDLCVAAGKLLRHCVVEVRRLAWRVAPLEQDFDWGQAWLSEPETEVRLVIAARLALEGEDPSLLLEFAECQDWRFRSWAAQGLARLNARESARRLALSSDEGPRAVGTSALLALEDYEWMEEHLMQDQARVETEPDCPRSEASSP